MINQGILLIEINEAILNTYGFFFNLAMYSLHYYYVIL